jgi:chlorobactene glucosyltransferase
MPRIDPLLVVSCLFLVVVVWLIARAVRQNGVLVRVGASPPPAGSMLPSMTVVVPARNEAANIGPCLRSLLAQQYPTERLRIVVIDDDSQDSTAAIVAAMAATDPRITLRSAPAPGVRRIAC